jgi:hypothetical protein
MYYSKAVTLVMALFQKQDHPPFKQGYDSVQLLRRESAVLSDTAQSERHKYRNQRAVSASLSVPPDTHTSRHFSLISNYILSKTKNERHYRLV